MKYRVDLDCDWKDFIARAAPKGVAEPVVIDAADLKTKDGKPLPEPVVAELVRRKALVPLPDDAQADATTKPAKTPKGL